MNARIITAITPQLGLATRLHTHRPWTAFARSYVRRCASQQDTRTPELPSTEKSPSAASTPAKSGVSFLRFAYDLHGIQRDPRPPQADRNPTGTYDQEPVVRENAQSESLADAPEDSEGTEFSSPATGPVQGTPSQSTAYTSKGAAGEAVVYEWASLPQLPEAPSYPCPYLRDDEIQTYLVPLYARGWFVGSSDWLRAKELPSGSVAPELVKKILFNDSLEAIDFVHNIKKVQKAEKHHGRLAIANNDIQFRTHTHSAVPSLELQDKFPPQIKPGITLRDVRLAYRVERLIQPLFDRGVVQGRLKHQRPVSPQTAEELEFRRTCRKQRADKQCAVCHSRMHSTMKCPDMRNILPRTPCKRCGEMHWIWLCPEPKIGSRGRARRKRERLRTQQEARMQRKEVAMPGAALSPPQTD